MTVTLVIPAWPLWVFAVAKVVALVVLVFFALVGVLLFRAFTRGAR